jgi:hypothetical protein
MKSSILLALALVLGANASAAAQEWGVNRRFFTFLDNEVTVEVTAETGGRLQVIRGEQGRIEVAARVEGGMSSFALGGRDGSTLRITTVGGQNADVILVVPEDTYLRVKLPNSRTGEVASSRPSGTFDWPGPDAEEVSSARMLPAPLAPATAHVSDEAPRVLDVPRLNSARRITVDIGSSYFEVSGTRWMAVRHGSTTNVEIQTGSEPEDLFISIPANTRNFTLRLGGKTALSIRGREVSSYCEPVAELEIAGGAARRFTYTPEAGRLRCR